MMGTTDSARPSALGRLPLPLLGMLLALAACGTAGDAGFREDSSVPASQDRTATCSQDGDCATGQGCHRGQGICLAFPQGAPSFSIAIDPPAGDSLVADQFTGVPLGPDGALDLALANPIVLAGAIFHAASAGEWEDFAGAGSSNGLDRSTGSGGRLVAIAEGRIPGTQFRSEAQAAFDPESGEWRYELALLPGLIYQATFIPARTEGAEALPPHRFPIHASASATMDVVLPPLATYLRVEGIVLNGDAQEPVPSAQVSCRVGDANIGTSALTDVDGRFAIVLPPDAGPVVIQARPGNGAQPFPARERVWDQGLEQLRAEYDTSPLVVIRVDPIPATRTVSVQVLGQQDGSDAAVALAKVSFSGIAGGGAASASSVTDDSGIVSVTLLEGVYELTILPPTTSPFATRRVTLDLTASTHQAFRQYLDPRVPITGTVVRQSDGTPVAGATVSLMTDRSDTLAATYGGAHDATFTAATDADGRFQVRVDPGRYALVADPPSGVPLARTASPSLDLSVARELHVPLPDARLVRGRIRSASGDRVLAGARIRLFLDVTHVSGWWSLDGTTFAGELLKAADVLTDQDGRYEAVVPRLVGVDGGTPDEPGTWDAVTPGMSPDDTGAWDGGTGSSEGFPLPPVEMD